MRGLMLAVWAAVAVATVAPAGAAEERIDQAAAYSAAHGEDALLIWRGGRVVYERGDRNGAPPRVFSITKSLVSIGVFRDAKSGGLSLGQAAGHEAARGVSLADLLNQTSGLPAAHREFYSQGLKDKESVLQRLKRTGSGQAFVYGPSHWEVLAEEIRLRRGTTLEGWLRKFVPGADPAAVARWRRDDRGKLFFSTGARMDARDLLPAGREVVSGMARARWPSEVRALLSSGTEANRMYALGFWLNRGARGSGAREVAVESALGRDHGADFWRGGCLSREAPADLLAMIGTRGQRVYIVPSQDLVVIRLGTGRGFSDAEFLRRLFG